MQLWPQLPFPPGDALFLPTEFSFLLPQWNALFHALQPHIDTNSFLQTLAARVSWLFFLPFYHRDILKSGGTAVDAAIAGLICTSVMNPQSSGLGGGVVFTIYNASTGTVEVINARETVPQGFHRDFDLLGVTLPFCSSGSQWIAVPGEIRGYEEAHKRYGRLPWKALFEPTIKLLSEPLVVSLSPELNSSVRTTTFRWPALQQTLRAVAENGATEFYEGQIGQALVEDLKKAGSVLSMEDLKAYKAEVSSALNITLNNNTTVFSPRPPMGGAVLLFILKILEGYKFSKASLATPKVKEETYHCHCRDLEVQQYVTAATLLSDETARHVRMKINASGDHPLSYYNLWESTYNHRYKSMGTSHISVLAADGSAVSATSTINYPFGSFVYSNRTGIILNNELADFCIVNRSINPGERPPSAMVPSILISKTGDMLVIGGAGGARIISATAVINKLWFGYDLEDAISSPIMHIINGNISFEERFSEDVRNGLLRRGHKAVKDQFALNVVQGISKEGKCISAYSDKRKMGKSAGY
uniref:Gamma-glutamyltransferase 5 n=1 Tax=Anas platyrhynchos TaxID=8839 RepID=A0A8B9SHU1_ANAPL